MHHFLRLTATVLTFVLGLALTWMLAVLNRPEVKPTNHGQGTVQLSEMKQRTYKVVQVGKEETKDGIPYSFSTYQTSDGMIFTHCTEFYVSPGIASTRLQERIKNSEVITREPVLDDKGRKIGEKWLVEYAPDYPHHEMRAALLWTNGSDLTFVQSASIENLLEFEKDNNRKGQ